MHGVPCFFSNENGKQTIQLVGCIIRCIEKQTQLMDISKINQPIAFLSIEDIQVLFVNISNSVGPIIVCTSVVLP